MPKKADTESGRSKGLYIYSSNIKTGSFEKFEKWVVENKERFASVQPERWALKDIYLTAFGLGSAHVEIHWEIDGYEALEIARATAESKGPYFKLLSTMHTFLDPATGSGRILKPAGDARTLIVGC